MRPSPRMTNKKDAVTYVTASFFQGEHSISRVLSHLRGDDYLSSQPIARLLKRRNPEGQRATSTLPYSVLLRMGFTKPAGLPTAGALLPHLSTLTTCVAVSFSMALSLGSLPPDVIRHPALRSPDFPRLNPFVCPAAITWPGCASDILAQVRKLVKFDFFYIAMWADGCAGRISMR